MINARLDWIPFPQALTGTRKNVVSAHSKFGAANGKLNPSCRPTASAICCIDRHRARMQFILRERILWAFGLRLSRR